MGHTGFSSFTQGPVLDALRHPLRTFMHSRSAQGKNGRIYLGHGEALIAFPMFGEGAPSTARLRQTLAEAGFAPYDWGLGADEGPASLGLKRLLRKLEEQVIEAFEAERQPLTLLGWGLSGLYAREIAKRLTPLVRQVITLGTPVANSAEWGSCRLLDAFADEFRSDPTLRNRLVQRPPVPCTSIYSLNDGVVPSRFCVETESTTSENIAIAQATHLELAHHPKAVEIISHRLAQPEGLWRAFDP